MTHLGEQDLFYFNQGTHRKIYERMGAHPGEKDGISGTYFAVWAPDAVSVQVIGDFCYWGEGIEMHAVYSTGIWQAFIPNIGVGALYKYRIVSRFGGRVLEKADPVGFRHEMPPKTASVVAELDYEWNDKEWMAGRRQKNSLQAPMSIYEVHLGSWMRCPEDGNRSLSYREVAPKLAAYVKEMGFTHVEFLPLMEHPFFGSWGYQATGFFAPTSRFGSPQDFMYLIDVLHQADIGVIFDWVPAHFPNDAHGLAEFDGSHLYEHADARKGFHPDWKSCIFNYGRAEVRSFLLSSALFWLDKYHIDGLRVDGVASMLYLDYSREAGEWIPNEFGGRENLDAISFLREMNIAVYSEFPDCQTIAEESTAWPMVSRPVDIGGLGFGMKWDMGWMHDSLSYVAREPVHRKFHHSEITFRAIYGMNENFVLPLSHDEVVHGKGSLINKMPGDDWQKFANLRLLYAYMWTLNGKKMLFMGGEFAQFDEWKHDFSIDWHLTQFAPHAGIQRLIRDLNHLYRSYPALYASDFEANGFEWIEASDAENGVLAYIRQHQGQKIVVATNFTPVPRTAYRLGVPSAGTYREVLNTDSMHYGGGNVGNPGSVHSQGIASQGRSASIEIVIPPLATVVFELI